MYSLETSVTHRRADIIDTVKSAMVKWTRSVPLITEARNVCLILVGRALGNGLYKQKIAASSMLHEAKIAY